MEEIKSLIEKIQQEGIQAAEREARKIEEEAKRAAADVMARAKKEADKLIADGRESDSRMQRATKDSLKQAGRDLIISLKAEINNMLDRAIVASVREALSADELSKIISGIIKHQDGKGGEKIEITINAADLKKLEGLIPRLKDEIKKGIVLKPSKEILGGFIISYDSGKSHFDFTDEGLAQYIGNYLKPKLAEFLK